MTGPEVNDGIDVGFAHFRAVVVALAVPGPGFGKILQPLGTSQDGAP